jgi:threonine-phosphate decarboxylase
MIIGHGGNKKQLAGQLACPVEEIIDMSSNLNPLGPPDNIHDLIKEKLSAIHSLPEPDAASMVKGFARYHGINPANVIAGNGTTYFIYTIPRALCSKRVGIAGPTYSDYKDACIMHQIEFTHCLAKEEKKFQWDMNELSQMADNCDLIFLCNPNNPTGTLTPKDQIAYLLKKHPDTVFVVDESYLPFVEDARNLSFVSNTHYPNLLVLSSMSKIFRIPGLRTGFLSGDKNLIEKVMGYYQPWSVNSLAQEVIKDIFANPEGIEPFYEKTRAYIKEEYQVFTGALENVKGIHLFHAPTYFILAKLDRMKARDFCDGVGRDKILIRDCENFHGLTDRFVRFSLKTRDLNLSLAQSIKTVLVQNSGRTPHV